MTWKTFDELTEMKAKAASVFPVLLGLAYSLYHFHTARLFPLFLFLLSAVLFHCFVDIWDNYNDYHHAVDTADYKVNTNIIGRENLNLTTIKGLLILFFVSSSGLGLWIAAMTGWSVFWIGLMCYFVGIFYAWAPRGFRTLSSLPVGEFSSGLTMGYFIFLLAVIIGGGTHFALSALTFLQTFIVAFPSVLLIKNLMLANNTCDLEEDEENHRFTIVHYLGKKWAVRWWLSSLVLAFLFVLLAIIWRQIPWSVALIFLLIPLMKKLATAYLARQIKKETFIASAKILFIFSVVQTALFYLGLVI
ncbi:MAG: 1,4-dihydroxy-2-naphthoate polyprenyltransferase [Streptococcaceae bacterium]|jgi:1,4-dihydroxy-2-naphthoate octaprenyltransferase|nr:1,4-dihydroxy-2-naphthoate polyprenyltransferase [Streptococcaceae bacterium]